MGAMETYDVVVVGYGSAGASAAIEAADAGAKVLVLDLGFGGGASALSGGVVYAGGGTEQQRAAGVDDSPENMFDYLKQEVGGVISDEALRRFTEESPRMITWLESHGLEFKGSLCPYKTSYPTDDYYLYYSGNEKAWPYKLAADPAPRGHRVVATALSSGSVLFEHLRAAAEKRGVRFQPLSRVDDLIIEKGAVVGVRYRTITSGRGASGASMLLRKLGNKFQNWVPQIGTFINAFFERRWEKSAVNAEVRAKSVILTAGGFAYNREMVAEHAVGAYNEGVPLGTVGDDGTGIRLGVEAGGSVDHMEKMSAWKFFSPPSALVEGVVVGKYGKRVANEDLYGATFGHHLITGGHEGRGFLILDSRQYQKAKDLVKTQTQLFQRGQTTYFFQVGSKKAASLDELMTIIDVPAEEAKATIAAYNNAIENGEADPAHKAPELCSPIEEGPFYAIDLSIKGYAPIYTTPTITLGGLRVDEETGQVLSETDEHVEGLYAAGRNAVGICSNSYLSGLSLADCIYSGRRAGVHAARTSRVVA